MPTTEYLPTPPASVSEGEDGVPNEGAMDVDTKKGRAQTPFRYASPAEDDYTNNTIPEFRRRVGRGGRIMFDRRIPFRTPRDAVSDRFAFDSDDDQPEIISMDERDESHRITHRAYLFSKARDPEAQAQAARRAQAEASSSNSHPNNTSAMTQPALHPQSTS